MTIRSIRGLLALLTAVACMSARAGDERAIEPGLQLQWAFGGETTQSAPSLRLALFPSAIAWQAMSAELGVREIGALERPSLLDVELLQPAELRLLGLPLRQTYAGLAAADDGEGLHWGVTAAGITLGVLGGLALLVNEAGDEIEEDLDGGFEPQPDGDDGDDSDSGGGILCINDQCVLPCGSTGPVNSCNDGG